RRSGRVGGTSAFRVRDAMALGGSSRPSPSVDAAGAIRFLLLPSRRQQSGSRLLRFVENRRKRSKDVRSFITIHVQRTGSRLRKRLASRKLWNRIYGGRFAPILF